MGKRPKSKTKPRRALTIRANLERFPWNNPRVIAGICRVVDIALAKIIAEDKTTGEQSWYDWLKRNS